MARVTLTVNDRQVTLDVHPGERLVDTLRDRLGLTGTKEGCGVGECGACTVVVDGDAVNSCLVLTVQCDGAAILTHGRACPCRPAQQVAAGLPGARRGAVRVLHARHADERDGAPG